MSIGSGRNSGRSVGSSVAFQFGSWVPSTISRFSASSAVRCVDAAATRFWRRVAASDCAWTTSIGAIVPTSTRVWLSCTSLLGQVERLLRDLDRLDREHVVPVGVADVRERVGNRGAKLDVGDVAVDARHRELLPCVVRPKSAEQRLRVLPGPVRGVRRIEEIVQAVRRHPAVIELDGNVAAAPGNALRDSGVVSCRVVDDARARGVGTTECVRRRVRLRLREHGRRERRVIDRTDAGDRDVVDLGVQALDCDVEISFERELHGIVERQPHGGTRVRGCSRGLSRGLLICRAGLTGGAMRSAACRMSS